jgi:hypothetical protein
VVRHHPLPGLLKQLGAERTAQRKDELDDASITLGMVEVMRQNPLLNGGEPEGVWMRGLHRSSSRRA